VHCGNDFTNAALRTAATRTFPEHYLNRLATATFHAMSHAICLAMFHLAMGIIMLMHATSFPLVIAMDAIGSRGKTRLKTTKWFIFRPR